MMQRTMQLRSVKRVLQRTTTDASTNGLVGFAGDIVWVPQQFWHDPENGGGEWRDVPMVIDDA